MQRIRLAAQVGSGLCGVLYVLDEPTIGLHPRDNRRLLDALQKLRDLGNTLLVVEHDREVASAADQLLDFGPGVGRLGGQIVAQGTPCAIARPPRIGHRSVPVRQEGNPRAHQPADSIAGPPLSLRERVGVKGKPPQVLHSECWIGKPVPLTPALSRRERGTMTLAFSASRRERGPASRPAAVGWKSAAATEQPEEHRRVDSPGRLHGGHGRQRQRQEFARRRRALQRPGDAETSTAKYDARRPRRDPRRRSGEQGDPRRSAGAGQTPTSNPATFTGAFDLIRSLFVQLPEAKLRGYTPRRFSFNVAGGRCEQCEGNGQRRIEMQFSPTFGVECDACRGRRYNAETLAVQFHGRSIADVLDMSCGEAAKLFEHIPKIRRVLATLCDVGLDYVTLGQTAPTLSGGEAQRVKLAAELSRADTGRTLYILDEPTTGLHFTDLAAGCSTYSTGWSTWATRWS